MAVRFNVYTKPYVVKIERGGMIYSLVRYSENEKTLREEMESELSEKTKIVSIKERE